MLLNGNKMLFCWLKQRIGIYIILVCAKTKYKCSIIFRIRKIIATFSHYYLNTDLKRLGVPMKVM